MARGDALVAARKLESETLVKKVKEIVDQMIENGEPVTPYSVAEKTTVSKTFIYQNKEVAAYIAEHRSPNPYNERIADKTKHLEKRISNLQRQLDAQEKEVEYYKAEMLKIAMLENWKLKEKIKKYEELEEQGIL